MSAVYFTSRKKKNVIQITAMKVKKMDSSFHEGKHFVQLTAEDFELYYLKNFATLMYGDRKCMYILKNVSLYIPVCVF